MTLPVWCARCKVAWLAEIAALPELISAVTSGKLTPVRCRRCTCHRAVRRILDEEQFKIEHPEVIWL